MGKLFLFVLLFFGADAFAQKELKIVAPAKEINQTYYSNQFITGLTCADCKIFINETEVKVYKTGAFAYRVTLSLGENIFKVKAVNDKREFTKNIIFNYSVPEPAKPVSTNIIESVKTSPEGNLLLSSGDIITFEVKALPGSNLTVMGQQLYETSGKMPGIYKGEYVVKATDNFRNIRPVVIMLTKEGVEVKKESNNTFTVMNSTDNDVVITKGRLPYLLFGLGDDRLGGAKIGYLDSLIKLKVIGKVGINYKIKLAPNRTAYIEDDLVDVAPKGELYSTSLTNKWNIYGDGKNDYIQIPLSSRLPYQSMQMVAPSKVIVDIFGAISNTNWITVLNSAKEITNVSYEQISDEVLRITINLKHVQHWGHSVYYSGNTLIIKVRNQPQDLSLSNLTIAVDAGHGGTNTGAVGITGTTEKTVTLQLAEKLKANLEKAGTKVIMTREKEEYFDNRKRITFYRDSLPDLLVSIHLNASADPLSSEGTSTFYRYPGYRNLNTFIHNRMLELGLKDYGNNGSFNFMLNSPTEYPNSLIETLFLSNPAEEEKILDPEFQDKMVQKIVLGLTDFLKYVKASKQQVE